MYGIETPLTSEIHVSHLALEESSTLLLLEALSWCQRS